MMLAYPIELTPDDNDTVMVTFPDLPEAVSFIRHWVCKGHREPSMKRAF